MSAALDQATTVAVESATCSSKPKSRRWVLWVAIASTLAVFLVVAGRVLAIWNRPFLSYSDFALFEMDLRDLGSRVEYLGAYSRFGWHHPGPMYTYMSGAVYWIAGERGISMWLAAVCINAAACLAIPVVAFRRLGHVGALVAVVVLSMYLVYLGPNGISNPWNPLIAIIPFLALLFCLWDVWCGARWTAVLVVLLGTFVVQAHVQYAFPLLVLASVTFAVRIVRCRHALLRSFRRNRLLVASCACLAGVLWALPVIEQLTTQPGNLRLVEIYVRTRSGSGVRLSEALSIVLREVAAPLQTVLGRGGIDLGGTLPSPDPLFGAIVLLVAAGALAYSVRVEAREVTALLVLAFVGCGAAVVSTMQIQDGLNAYLVAWISQLFVPIGVGVGGAAVAFLRRRRLPRLMVVRDRWRDPMICGLMVVVTIVTSVVISRQPYRPANVFQDLNPVLEDALPRLPNDGPILIVDSAGGTPFMVWSLIAALDRYGFDARGADVFSVQLGQRAIRGQLPTLSLRLFEIGEGDPPRIPGHELFARGRSFALYRILG